MDDEHEDVFVKNIFVPGLNISFDSAEILELLVSMLALCFAMNIVYLGIDSMMNSPLLFGLHMIVFMIGAAPGFLIHEIAHKWVAIKYGAVSYYKASAKGLIMMIIFSFLGFVFAAPGAVMIRAKYLASKERAFISMAGPLVNIVISLFSLLVLGGLILIGVNEIPVSFGFEQMASISPFTLGEVAYFSAMINAFLAFFNMLPFFPLDGSKIIVWNKTKWLMLIMFAGVLMIAINPGFIFMIIMFVILAFIMSVFARTIMM